MLGWCSTTRLREEQSSAVWVRGKRQNTGGFPIIRTWRYYTWAFFLLLYLFFFVFLKKDDWGLSLSQSRCILFNQAKNWGRSGAVVSSDYDDFCLRTSLSRDTVLLQIRGLVQEKKKWCKTKDKHYCAKILSLHYFKKMWNRCSDLSRYEETFVEILYVRKKFVNKIYL